MWAAGDGEKSLHSAARDVVLLLALTDQFAAMARRVEEARELLPRLSSEYEQAYYAGIICERRARAVLAKEGPGSGFVAYDFFQQALEWYGKAEALRPAGNDDALLRWNTCVGSHSGAGRKAPSGAKPPSLASRWRWC
jgi:hypothetical protein